jgi:methionyl aminopeptidase
VTIYLKTEEHIEHIRRAGKIASTVLSALSSYIVPGVTTKYIDDVVEQMTRQLGGIPACKGYKDFPAASCISVGQEAVHCIPGERIIKEGDVVKVDYVVDVNGWKADTARTYLVPPIKLEIQAFAETCYLAMYEGIKKAVDGNKVSDISKAIEDFVKPKGYGIVKGFVGHGIGRSIHEEPSIPNYVVKEKDALLCAGMTICIEPILTLEPDPSIEMNGWNTKAKSIVTHSEHTILITKTLPEIITIRKEEQNLL